MLHSRRTLRLRNCKQNVDNKQNTLKFEAVFKQNKLILEIPLFVKISAHRVPWFGKILLWYLHHSSSRTNKSEKITIQSELGYINTWYNLLYKNVVQNGLEKCVSTVLVFDVLEQGEWDFIHNNIHFDVKSD